MGLRSGYVDLATGFKWHQRYSPCKVHEFRFNSPFYLFADTTLNIRC